MKVRVLLSSLLWIGVCLCSQLFSLFFTSRPLAVGTEAPPFSLPNVDGATISLSDFEGRIVLLNFWSAT